MGSSFGADRTLWPTTVVFSSTGTNVTVNSLHPGTVNSELTRHSTLMTILFTVSSIFLKTPQEGAQTSVYCAVAEELHAISGKHFRSAADRGQWANLHGCLDLWARLMANCYG